MTEVVAGIIEGKNGFLICQRTAESAHGLKWEFPGGKVEPGETPSAALIRELEEELGIVAVPGEELMRYEFSYPGKPAILLIFLSIAAYAGKPANRIFEQIRWCRADTMRHFDFLDGDVRFLEWFTARQ